MEGRFSSPDFYVWRNISIIRFVEDGKSYLRIKTSTPGIKAMAWPDKPITSLKKKKKSTLIDQKAVEAAQAIQAEGEKN